MSAIYAYLHRSIRSLSLCQWLNILGLLGISFSLVIAFYYQLWHHELPCPLCLLQRVGLICIGLGFLMNIRFGSSNLHYGFAIVSAVMSGIASARQMFLHIVPGSGSYGSPLLGIHFYTWGLLASISVILFIAITLIIESAATKKYMEKRPNTHAIGKTAIHLFAFLTAANLFSTLLECGFGQCADDPKTYQITIS